MQRVGAGDVPHAPMPGGPGAAQVAQFFIPAAASLQERRPRTLKHGDTFALFDHNGDAYEGPGSPEGLYHCDTRHLSHLYLTIGGGRLILLSSTRSEEHTSELQSLMRILYAVFCLKKKTILVMQKY